MYIVVECINVHSDTPCCMFGLMVPLAVELSVSFFFISLSTLLILDATSYPFLGENNLMAKILLEQKLHIEIGGSLRITGARPGLIDELTSLLTFNNPEYKRLKRIGRGLGTTPPTLCYCTRDKDGSYLLPRDATRSVLTKAKKYGGFDIVDSRCVLPEIDITLLEPLQSRLQKLLKKLIRQDRSVFEGGWGKIKPMIVLGAIAARKQPALILVHSKDLLHFWEEQVRKFLGIDAGLLGDGIFNVQPITVAIVNSVRNGKEPICDKFGFLIVDQCNKVPSTVFTDILPQFPAKYLLGLDEPYGRRDGLGCLIRWYIGVHRVQANSLARSGSARAA